MARLIEVQFAGYSAYLRPCQEGVRAVAPDAAGKAGTLLEQAIQQVTGSRPCPCYRQDDTWMVSLEKLTPEVCRGIVQAFERFLLQEQRRLSDLAEALGDPRPAPPEPAHAEEEAEAEIRVPPDPEEELRRFREEVDRMVAKWGQNGGRIGAKWGQEGGRSRDHDPALRGRIRVA
jgi:hypothetical protein